MNFRSYAAVFVLGWCFLARSTAAPAPVRERTSLNADWRFTKGDPDGTGSTLDYAALKPALLAAASAPAAAREALSRIPAPPYATAAYDDSGWRQLDLPHDWGIESPFEPNGVGDTGKLPYWGIGWYRHHLRLPAADAGRLIALQIDGAMAYSTVWVNGHLAGGWAYGYTSYQVDLTPYLHPGEDNLIAVRLDNPPESSRWYPGGGIYRNVWLLKTAPIHVAHWGTFVTTPDVTRVQAAVDLTVSLVNESPASAQVVVRTELFELSPSGARLGGVLASSPAVAATLPPGAGSSEAVPQRVTLRHPKLWSTQSPTRYVAVTTVTTDRLEDVYETTFGVRTLTFDPDQGFFLNGIHLRFQGVCDHHDLGALGTALNVRALQRQLELLEQMGVNAIRTSHNPPAPELLDLCDRMGFVVMDEAFDVWDYPKRPRDYNVLFQDWHRADLTAMLRRDRNHPSIVMWSIGNEIPEVQAPATVKIGAELAAIVHHEDSTRPVTAACDNPDAEDKGLGDVLDAYGVNHHWMRYAEFRKTYPHKFVFGSETSATTSSRGIYYFPVSNDKLAGLMNPNDQISSYDLTCPVWAWPQEDEFRAEDQTPGVAGEFVWTGFDYLGEPEPYRRPGDRSRSSYFGIIDLAGFKKDRFYIYQARWRRDLPMAHLLPHWTWPERRGKVTPVHVFTSGDEGELFLNGKSLGKQKIGADYRLRWDNVIYQPGTLKVVVFKNRKKWAEDIEKTANDPAALRATADRSNLHADGSDLAFVTVAVTDRAGTVAPRADNEVRFKISGPGDLVGVDNGDPTSYESFKGAEHQAFSGLVLAIVRTRRGAPGVIKLTASADGLTPATVEVRAK